jgi:hypothetical protein
MCFQGRRLAAPFFLNAKCKMQNEELRKLPIAHFAFCILHFALAFDSNAKAANQDPRTDRRQ